MTIQTTSKQHIGGAMKKRDQPEWMANSRSAVCKHALANKFMGRQIRLHEGLPFPRLRRTFSEFR
jgi:hypothetical protein